MALFIILVFTCYLGLVKSCDDNWIKYRGVCYHKPQVEETDFKSSVEICSDINSEVLTINSKEEHEFVSNYLLHPEFNIWVNTFNSQYKDWFNQSMSNEKCAALMHARRHEAHLIPEHCDNRNEVLCKIGPQKCQKGWSQFGNKCYFALNNGTTCIQAQAYCSQFNAQLTSIRNEEENQFVASLCRKTTCSTCTYWIGAASFKLPNFHWLDGTPFIYTNWKEGYPVQSVGHEYAEIETGIGNEKWVNSALVTSTNIYPLCSYEIN